MNPRTRRSRRQRRTILPRGRRALHLLTAAYQGRPVTAASLREAAVTPLRAPTETWVQVADEHGGHLALRSDAGPSVTGAVRWDDCGCGGEDAEGEPLPGCGPGCPRGSWQGPLVWAAQDAGDVPGLWGLTEVEALAYLLPRWAARGITPASQRGAGERDREARREHAW